MWHRLIEHCSNLSTLQVVGFGAVLALGIEFVTIWSRFGLGLEATRDTAFMGTLTLGVRLHHGYLGLLLTMGVLASVTNPGLRNALLMLGVGLLLSDVIHHFAVLLPITGSPEFDVFYPNLRHRA